MADDEDFLSEMRGNAGRLSDCLIQVTLSQKIKPELKCEGSEQRIYLADIKIKFPIYGNRVLNGKGKFYDSQLTSRREYLSVDPFTGQRKLVTIVERPLPSGPLRAQSPTQLNSPETEQLIQNKKHLLASAYESRIVEIQPNLLEGLEVEQICGNFDVK
uniref:Uncharacterized protein n=2 Tax=Meloidogyne javanica TaxID=6303 RepID=A0A915N627_MELJA